MSSPWIHLICQDCNRHFDAAYDDAAVCSPCYEKRRVASEKSRAKKQKTTKPRKPKLYTKNCVACGIEFQTKTYKRKSCGGRSCRGFLRFGETGISRQTQTCQACEMIFYRGQLQRFCSVQCSGKGQQQSRRKINYEEIKRLHLIGQQGRQIAQQLACSDASVNYALKKLGLKP